MTHPVLIPVFAKKEKFALSLHMAWRWMLIMQGLPMAYAFKVS